MKKSLTSPALLLAATSVVGILSGSAATPVSCESNDICEELQGEGSECNPDGICTNPFESGCLYRRMPGWNKKRVCGSSDPPDAAERGICVEPEFDYLEVRLSSGNWESITFNAWVLQVVLSEMLGVPTSLEPGEPNIRIDFYDPSGAVEWGAIRNSEGFANAWKYGDCRLIDRESMPKSEYEPCANFIPEFWSASGPWAATSVNEGSMEPPEALGVLAQETLFVPKFTAQRDPSLLSYIGLQGEENRQKLADTFLRPTTWKSYCEQVSLDGCGTPDGVAERAPRDDEDGDAYFNELFYTGHFRKTELNIGNETHPPTGHVIDYPCDWTSYIEPQMYHLGIALSGDNHGEESRGYEEGRYIEIVKAANATKSNIIFQWAYPDPYYEAVIGTDMEMTAVIMPSVTQECLENKRVWGDSCSADWDLRVGSPLGACGEPPLSLHTAMSTSLTKEKYDTSIKEAARSPSVDALKLYTMTSTDYGSWFNLLVKRGALTDAGITKMRDLTCEWIVENFETVEQFIPFTYPRTIQSNQAATPLSTASVVLASVALILVVAASAIVYRSQHREVMKFAQIEFLGLLLVGLLLITIGALMDGLPPSDGSCIASVWLVNVGYTLELAPLLVKVAAINKLSAASRRMVKAQVSRRSLYGSVAVVTCFVILFLIVWTALDAPEKQGELSLSTAMSQANETIVFQTFYCSSESEVWQYVAIGWTGILLFSATVLAVEMRNVRQQFNESQTLGFLTYSHFVFAILRLVTFFLADSVGNSDSDAYRSLLFSVDSVAALGIYFLPKFVLLRNPDSTSDTFGTGGSYPSNRASRSEASAASSTQVKFTAGAGDESVLSNMAPPAVQEQSAAGGGEP